MKHYGTAWQDRFVEELLVKPDGMINGSFIDIGCYHPSSNTLSLEELGWSGILIDRNPVVKQQTPTRKNQYWIGDSTIYPWEGKLHVNYLSLDVDEASLATLEHIPLNDITFDIITIEHDHYAYQNEELSPRIKMRKILSRHGYHLVCSNVCDIINGKKSPFEDWWVGKNLAERAVKFHCDCCLYQEIFNV